MIILDRVLTVNRLKKHLSQLTETMNSYSTYKKSLEIAKEMSILIGEDENLKRIIFALNDLKSEKIYGILENNGRPDIVNFLKSQVPNYSTEDTKLFKVLVNAEINRIHYTTVENVAFGGGGGKGPALTGVLRRMNELEMNIKRVSGTSAGAITALPFALGYTPRKIEEIVLKYDFTRFMYESKVNSFLLKNTVMTEMMHQSAYLNEFKKQFDDLFLDYLVTNPAFFAKVDFPFENVKIQTSKYEFGLIVEQHYKDFINLPELKGKLKFLPLDDNLRLVIKKARDIALKTYEESLKSEKDKDFVKELTTSMSSDNIRMNDLLIEFVRLKKNEDIIEEFFGDLIENRLIYLAKSTEGEQILEKISEGLSSPERLRNVTFKEFKGIRENFTENRWGFKDLAICICERKSSNVLKTFDKDNYNQIDVYADNPDSTYSEMPIKTAVRISMNLPGAFSSYEYKDKHYVDGGVRANFPMHVFDKTLALDKRTTIGFCLAPAENYSRTDDAGKVLNPDRSSTISQNNMLKRAIIHVKNYFSDVITQIHGNKLDNNTPLDFLDLTRIGVINVLDIDTTEFNLSQNTKINLFKQGYYTAHDLFEDDYNAQLRHFVERMKIIHSKMDSDLKILENISVSHKNEFVSEMQINGHDFEHMGKYIKGLQDDVHYKLGETISRNKKSIKPN
jgi:predicted acylesterase/phospholipase RssA